MADRVRGITIEIGGNTTGLSKALSGVNKEINSTQKQLKDVERLLKMDPGNTELLRQKQELLNKAVGETKTKLDSLREAEKQVQEQVAKGETSKEQYEALQREIVVTENNLKELEKQANQSNVALSKIGAVADDVAEKTANLSQKTKMLSGMAVGAIAGVTGLAYKAGLAADDLNTMEKQSGFSTEQLQIWKYGADRVDVSMETIVSSAAKMKKNMISTSSTVTDAWEKLGISVTDESGKLRDSTVVFDEAVLALGKIENETERDTLAMTLFGKSADNLAGLLDDGGKAFKEYGEEAKEAGLILSQDALDSANEFNDAVDKLKAEAAGTFAGIGTEVATMLLPHLEKLGNFLENVLSWLKGLDEGQLEMIGTILLVVASISPLLKIISTASSMVSWLATTGIPGVSSAMTFLAANPVALLIAAIIGLVALFALKGDEIQDILKKIDDFLQNVFAVDWTTVFGPVLGEQINSFMKNIQNMRNSLKQILNGIIDFVRGVFTGNWERAWNGIVQVFSGIFSGLATIAKSPINGIIGLLNGAIGGLNTLIRGANKIPGVDIGTIGKIPYLASGGVLTKGSAYVGEAGPELLTVMGGKAVVQPLTNQTATHRTDVGGIHITIYGAPGQNENELAELVSEKISAAVAREKAVYA